MSNTTAERTEESIANEPTDTVYVSTNSRRHVYHLQPDCWTLKDADVRKIEFRQVGRLPPCQVCDPGYEVPLQTKERQLDQLDQELKHVDIRRLPALEEA